MEPRTIYAIKRDIRNCWDTVSISRQMRDKECEEHFVREALAYERELELRQTGYVLSGV